jgi:hypothetical protein
VGQPQAMGPHRETENCGAACSWRYAGTVEASWNVMAHAQKPDFVFQRNGRVHLNRRGCQFSRLLAAEVCASASVMLDTPYSEVVWRVLATHSIRQLPLHFPSRALPCAITFQLDSTNKISERPDAAVSYKIVFGKLPTSKLSWNPIYSGCESFLSSVFMNGTTTALHIAHETAICRKPHNSSKWDPRITWQFGYKYTFCQNVLSTAHLLVPTLTYSCVEKKIQLDTTEWLIALIICSTCFGELCAHPQELDTICVLLPSMMCNAGQRAMCRGWGSNIPHSGRIACCLHLTSDHQQPRHCTP